MSSYVSQCRVTQSPSATRQNRDWADPAVAVAEQEGPLRLDSQVQLQVRPVRLQGTGTTGRHEQLGRATTGTSNITPKRHTCRPNRCRRRLAGNGLAPHLLAVLCFVRLGQVLWIAVMRTTIMIMILFATRSQFVVTK